MSPSRGRAEQHSDEAGLTSLPAHACPGVPTPGLSTHSVQPLPLVLSGGCRAASLLSRAQLLWDTFPFHAPSSGHAHASRPPGLCRCTWAPCSGHWGSPASLVPAGTLARGPVEGSVGPQGKQGRDSKGGPLCRADVSVQHGQPESLVRVGTVPKALDSDEPDILCCGRRRREPGRMVEELGVSQDRELARPQGLTVAAGAPPRALPSPPCGKPQRSAVSGACPGRPLPFIY